MKNKTTHPKNENKTKQNNQIRTTHIAAKVYRKYFAFCFSQHLPQKAKVMAVLNASFSSAFSCSS